MIVHLLLAILPTKVVLNNLIPEDNTVIAPPYPLNPYTVLLIKTVPFKWTSLHLSKNNGESNSTLLSRNLEPKIYTCYT